MEYKIGDILYEYYFISQTLRIWEILYITPSVQTSIFLNVKVVDRLTSEQHDLIVLKKPGKLITAVFILSPDWDDIKEYLCTT